MAKQRIALITGANAGIGLHAAEQLAERDVRVLLGARNAERGQAAVDELIARSLPVELLLLDVTDAASIASNAAYQSSKAALNMLTFLYANELRDQRILVNAVSPGYRATGLNGGLPTPGAGDPAGGAEVIVRAALLPDDGPTGTFLADTGDAYPW